MRTNTGKTIIIGVLFLGLIASVALAAGVCPTCTLFANTSVYERAQDPLPPPPPPKPKVAHQDIPAQVKGLYVSACGAASPSIREHIMHLLDTTELNSVVIDIKDYTGSVSFIADDIDISDGKGCRAQDMKDYVAELHKHGVYVIGRITVFQDPLYTKQHPEQAVQSKSNPGHPWKDYKGLSFIEVASTQYWDRVVDIARASSNLGFDELNFDYVRYPSDGPMSDAVYTHSDELHQVELERFFKYLTERVKKPDESGYTPVVSADLFGMTTTNTDDLNIGQVLERALPYFDYVAPMVYPSHYPKNFIGLANPNSDVYKVVQYSMDRAVTRTIATETSIGSLAYKPLMQEKQVTDSDGTMHTETARIEGMYEKPAYNKNKLRPWLQDFDYGGNYGPAEVRAQIQATYDVGLNSWMLWDAANKYTPEALHAQ